MVTEHKIKTEKMEVFKFPAIPQGREEVLRKKWRFSKLCRCVHPANLEGWTHLHSFIEYFIKIKAEMEKTKKTCLSSRYYRSRFPHVSISYQYCLQNCHEITQKEIVFVVQPKKLDFVRCVLVLFLFFKSMNHREDQPTK